GGTLEVHGFTFGFYRRYWDIIGNDVVDAVKWFFFAWRDLERRPISLIGSLYKVIAKVLANRLVTVLHDIVDEIQSAFVTDRQFWTVDFEKAYDSVRWDFFDDILRRFGFGEKWSLHGEDGKIGKKVQPRYPSTWLNIINEIECLKLHGIDMGSFITPKLGNGVNTSFKDVAWCVDIAFKNLVPRLYVLESMKNIEVASKLSHGGLEFSFRRNPRGEVEQTQFERLKEMVEGVTL
nr:RNA-directed DNA polymerase, eukaryota, reverse transcriptase zinc-binding domain protein [Tanacetum cinerariifolium]